MVCDSAPLVCANVRADKPVPVPTPIGIRPRMSGTLNVVEPSPVPKVVPMTAYKAEYVERLTAEPSQISQAELGVVDPA